MSNGIKNNPWEAYTQTEYDDSGINPWPGGGGMKRDHTNFTTMPTIGINQQLGGVQEPGLFTTPQYPEIGDFSHKGVSWMKRAGMNIGEFGEKASGKLGGMSNISKMGMIGGLGSIVSGLVGRGKRRDEQTAAKEEYDTMRSAYQELDTSNLYANVKNQYRDLENTFEDLTVNQQQAQFEAQQNAQVRANIMEGFRGAAGASGIAGLAQAMASQAQLSTQKASASIGLQEAQQQKLMATEGARIQMAERAGEAQAEQMRLAGEAQARGLEWQKTGTMLGMAQQRKGMADQAIAESNAAIAGGVGQVAGSLLTGGLL